jgi:hypothetical protein
LTVAILRGDGGAEGELVAEGAASCAHAAEEAASWAKPAERAASSEKPASPPHDLEIIEPKKKLNRIKRRWEWWGWGETGTASARGLAQVWDLGSATDYYSVPRVIYRISMYTH